MKKQYYEATKNNFIIFECTQGEFEKNRKKFVKNLQIDKIDSGLILLPSKIGIKKMLVLEKDNSISAMCGNGIRAVACYLKDNYKSTPEKITLEILTGTISVDIVDFSKNLFRVNMGPVISLSENKKNFLDIGITIPSDKKFTEIDKKLKNAKLFTSAGEPHVVVNANLNKKAIEDLFWKIQNSGFFENGVNLNVINVISQQNEIKNLTFERGVNNFTKSCGTGSTSVVNFLNIPDGHSISIINEGGTLEFEKKGSNFICTGPANKLTI